MAGSRGKTKENGGKWEKLAGNRGKCGGKRENTERIGDVQEGIEFVMVGEFKRKEKKNEWKGSSENFVK